MRVESGVSSSPGRKRSRNEDFTVANNALGLFVVIDGMGGHARGDVASQIVGESIHKFVADTASFVAELRGEPVEGLAETTTANFFRLFNKAA